MIRGITFDKQLFKSNDFALMTKRFFGDMDGVVYGSEVTSNANNILINPGYFQASGYYVCLTSQEVIPAVAGTNKLVFEIDLSKTNTEVAFNQGSFKFISGALTQQDLFNGGTIYQIHIADVVSTGSAITSLTVQWKNVFGNALLKTGGTVTGNLSVTGTTDSAILKQNGKIVSEIYSGTTVPNDSLGKNNDIYIQYE